MRPGLSWDMPDIREALGVWRNYNTGGDSGAELLESLAHEMAHVLDATGGFELHGRKVHDVVSSLLTVRRMDANELRACAVTRLVLIAAGELNAALEDVLTTGVKTDTDMNDGTAVWLFGKMRDSQRSKRMALKVIDYLMANGAIMVDEGARNARDRKL